MAKIEMEETKGIMPNKTRFIVKVLQIGEETLEDLKKGAEELRKAVAVKGGEINFTVFPLELEENCLFYQFPVDCWLHKRLIVGNTIVDTAEGQDMDIGKLKRRFK